MGNLVNYFDFEAFGRELFMWDYNMGPNGNVFRRISYGATHLRVFPKGKALFACVAKVLILSYNKTL